MSKNEEVKIPEEFHKIIKDFMGDLQTTFPEYSALISKWWPDKQRFDIIENVEEREKSYKEEESKAINYLFQFCQKKLPPRFFDILYQNEEIFGIESEHDTEFLPSIHFKNLWQFDISQKTRDTIWKYLQLILFATIGSLDNKDAFGDAAKMFDTVNEEDFKDKLEETLSKIQELFTMNNMEFSEKEGTNESQEKEGINLPNANDLHEHITGMLDGKLGKLAKEIAEETAANLNIDMENVTDMKDVFNTLIKNPTKLMGLVKDVGSKLDTRLKSGELKESELIAEATEMVNRMKNMPGMENIQEMLNKLGMGGMGAGLGKNAKVNLGAMESQLNNNMKKAQLKERLRAKAEMNRILKEQEIAKQNEVIAPNPNALTDEQLISMFSTGEKPEKTPRTVNKNKKPKSKK
jgi:hypothetical protein